MANHTRLAVSGAQGEEVIDSKATIRSAPAGRAGAGAHSVFSTIGDERQEAYRGSDARWWIVSDMLNPGWDSDRLRLVRLAHANRHLADDHAWPVRNPLVADLARRDSYGPSVTRARTHKTRLVGCGLFNVRPCTGSPDRYTCAICDMPLARATSPRAAAAKVGSPSSYRASK